MLKEVEENTVYLKTGIKLEMQNIIDATGNLKD